MLSKLIAKGRPLLADGATGTNLIAAGLDSGECAELWNETHPDRIRALHQSFVDAGADIILSNSLAPTAVASACAAWARARRRSANWRRKMRAPSPTGLAALSSWRVRSVRPARCSPRSGL